MAEPWDRKSGETERSYAAFRAYMELGPSRSVSEAYRQRERKKDAKQADGTWNKWVKVHHWSERALAWDHHVTAVQTIAIDRVTEEDAEAWTRRKSARVEFDYQQAEKLSGKIDRLIDGLDTPRDLKDAAAVVTAASNLAWAAINTALPDPNANFDPETATDEEIRAVIARIEGKTLPYIARTG